MIASDFTAGSFYDCGKEQMPLHIQVISDAYQTRPDAGRSLVGLHPLSICAISMPRRRPQKVRSKNKMAGHFVNEKDQRVSGFLSLHFCNRGYENESLTRKSEVVML
jgi:hypothetical protein